MRKFFAGCRTYMWLWLPILTAVGIVTFFPLMYLTEDDTMINQVVADVSVEGSEYFCYFTVIFGWSLRLLYLCCPALNWYAIVLITCTTGSFCIFLYLLSEAEQKSGRKQELLHAVSFGIFFVLFVYNLFHLAFTNVAFFTTLSGGMLFLSLEPPHRKKNIAIMVFSLLWTAYGMTIRVYATKVILVLLTVFVLVRMPKIKLKTTVLFIICIGLIYNGAFYTHRNYVSEEETPHLYQYRRFEGVRIEIIDKDIIDYAAHKDRFEAVDIAKEDLDMYYQWSYADYNVFHPKTFGKTILNIIHEHPPYSPDVLKALQHMFTSVINLAYMGVLLLIFLLGKKKNKLGLFLFCGCAEGMVFLLLLRGRLLWRLQLAVMQIGIIPLIILLLWGANYVPSTVFPFKKKPWLQSVCICVVCALAVCLIAVRNGETIRAQKEKIEAYAPIVNYVKAESEEGKRFVSLAEHRVHFYYPEVTLLQKREKPYYVNVGEADTFHPHWMKTLEQCGFSEFSDSVFRALIDGEDVYAFTNQQWDFDEVASFLRRHYDESVEWVMEEKIGDWCIASFRKTE